MRQKDQGRRAGTDDAAACEELMENMAARLEAEVSLAVAAVRHETAHLFAAYRHLLAADGRGQAA